MKEIWLILACVPLYVVNAFCDKAVSAQKGNTYNFLYNAIKFFVGSLLLLPMLLMDKAPKLEAGVILCGVATGVMYALSKTLMLKGYEKTSVAFMTLCHSAGMILPCLLGHFFWAEPLGVLSVIGMLLAVVSIVLLKGGKEEKKGFDPVGVALGAVIFLSSGIYLVFFIGLALVKLLKKRKLKELLREQYPYAPFVLGGYILCRLFEWLI